MSDAPVIRVLLVEDQFFARLALRTVIQDCGGMEVAAETDRGGEALELYLRHRPDVTVMDLRMPDLSGFDAIARIREADPEARIVVLSNYEGDQDVRRALDAGAMAYLTKDAGAGELTGAILAVRSGRRYLPARLAAMLQQCCPADELTERELEVLQALAQGQSNQQIATQLGIAEKTVRMHLTHIFEKLSVTDRTQAVLAAIHRGLTHL